MNDFYEHRPGPKPAIEGRPRRRVIAFKVSPEDLGAIQAKAREQGVTVGTLVHQAALRALGLRTNHGKLTEAAEKAKAAPAAAPKPRPVDPRQVALPHTMDEDEDELGAPPPASRPGPAGLAARFAPKAKAPSKARDKARKATKAPRKAKAKKVPKTAAKKARKAKGKG